MKEKEAFSRRDERSDDGGFTRGCKLSRSQPSRQSNGERGKKNKNVETRTRILNKHKQTTWRLPTGWDLHKPKRRCFEDFANKPEWQRRRYGRHLGEGNLGVDRGCLQRGRHAALNAVVTVSCHLLSPQGKCGRRWFLCHCTGRSATACPCCVFLMFAAVCWMVSDVRVM